MRFAGVVPADAPDPRVELEQRARDLPFPALTLRPQPALTRLPGAGFMESNGTQGRSAWSVSFGYTLWRHPEDHDDPRNLLELDEDRRRPLDDEPPWPRPRWLIDGAQLLRYPMLWEAIRTTWHADPEWRYASLDVQLVDHVNHILRNRFREELGLPPPGPGEHDDTWKATTAAVAPALVSVDGDDRPAVHVDTDPFVYGVGFRLSPDVVCTVAVPRDDLPLFDLAVETWSGE